MIKPQWTEKYNTSQGGRDFLAYEYVGILMLEKLLPGISTITYRVRYYSFFPWVLYRFFNTEQQKIYRNFRKYLKIKSLAFLYANGLNCSEKTGSGVDGIDYVRKDLSENGKKEVYQWDEQDVKKYRDNYGVYSNKIKQLGITAKNKEYDLDSLTKERGKQLAKSFEKSVSNTKYFKQHCDKNDLNISAEVLEEYGKVGGVLELNDFPQEQQLLLEAFFRLSDVKDEKQDSCQYYIDERFRSAPGARRESLFLFLDIISKQKEEKFRYDDFRKLAYFSKVQKRGYRPHSKLKHNLEFWRIFQARQYFVYALETIFREVTLVLDGQSMPFDVLMKALIDKKDFEYLNKKFGLEIDSSEQLSKLVGDIGAGEKGEIFDREHSLDSELNEEALFQEIKKNLKSPEHLRNIGYSLLMLIVLYLRLSYYRQKRYPYWEFAKIGGRTNVSIDVFFNEVGKQIASGVTVKKFLEWVVKDLIIAQHRRVALAKLAWYKKDTFHFYCDGGLIRGARIAYPKMNAPKFKNVLNILTDLGLIKGVNNQYTLTSNGTKILQKI